MFTSPASGSSWLPSLTFNKTIIHYPPFNQWKLCHLKNILTNFCPTGSSAPASLAPGLVSAGLSQDFSLQDTRSVLL